MSGLLIGVLLARTVPGMLAATGAWRTVYLVSAGAMLAQAPFGLLSFATFSRQSILVVFVAGVVVLDIGAQGLHITNQGAIYRIRPEARSRITSVYMMSYFAGGGLGSWMSTSLYEHFGWDAVSALGASFAAIATALSLATAKISFLRRVEDPVAVPAARP